MPNTIAEFYTGELSDWNDNIVFYYKEIDDFEKKLVDVIRRNSIEDIAEKVEWQQTPLDHVSDKFLLLQHGIQQQQQSLKPDSILLENSKINMNAEKRQNELRNNMRAAEQEYIDAKFNCYNFLSGTLKK